MCLLCKLWCGRAQACKTTYERSLEPLTETDRDEKMMDNPGDDDAGKTSAVKSKIQPLKPSDQQIATHEACGHYLYRDWCRACWWHWAVNTLTNDGMKNKTVCLCRAWTTGSSLTETTVSTPGPLPFLVVKVKPSMMIWSMTVQCRGVLEAAIKETVESLNRLG